MKKRTIPETPKAEWTATGSFMHKPKHGWLHSNEDIARGVTYRAVYVGCVKIMRSVKSLSLEDRSIAIQEGTARCCDKAGFVKYKKRSLPNSLSDAFGGVFAGYRGESILITISKSNVKVVLEKTGVLICDHFIENISFASGGEKKYSAFVSYIAKDNVFDRACFVIQCEKDNKSEVIQSIGQAFEAKYKDFMSKPLVAAEVPEKFSQPVFPDVVDLPASQPGYASLNRHNEVSNGDVGPYSKLNRKEAGSSCDTSASAEYSILQHGPLSQMAESSYDRIHAGREFSHTKPPNIPVVAGADYDKVQTADDFAAIYDNPVASPTTKSAMLIDFNDNSPEYHLVKGVTQAASDHPQHSRQTDPSPYDNPRDLMQSHEYQRPSNIAAVGGRWEKFDEAPQPPISNVNEEPVAYFDPIALRQQSGKYASLHHDSDDSAEYQSPEEIAEYQRPRASEYSQPNTHYQSPKALSPGRPKSFVGPLENKPWFHGHISRIDAEMLLENDGQYLVRESSSSAGQYVLSGMKDGQHRHLLLVDPQGHVRTKDRAFATVEELLVYHQTNGLPIISGGSEVHILTPVLRNTQGNNNATVYHGSSFKI